ncbi:hypothetical protein [Krasilnikovia sp. M28-CT-15]|uniref:hypothetical protein n=1 Tax=Krasilnikovia sp. M28-CT-15 TaxID=3373540 RepID=UPI0038762958
MTEPVPTPPRRSQQNWLLAALPAFPLLLLVLRLWYLSRQDLPTMLLLVQYVNPLGMISALFITLLWAVPAVVLVLRALGGLLLVSARDQTGATRSLLAVTAQRMPDWVVVIAGLLAAFTWQLRFLPALVMLLVVIMGLTAWQRHPDDRLVLRVVSIGVPVAAAAVVLVWVLPGIVDAVRRGEVATAVLLLAPPLLGTMLAGPVPVRFARLATHWPAVLAALIAPFVVGVVFLRAPILPTSAVEVATGDGVEVLRGQVITVDDVATTILDRDGLVHFVRNEDLRTRTICPETAEVPASAVEVRGWPVEASALEWVAPARRLASLDPRCLGRPLDPA